MFVSKIRVYEKAVDQRESRLRAYTDVVGDTATRKVRLDDARILIGEIEEFATTHGLRKFLDDIGKPTSSAEIPDLGDFAANLDQKMINDAIRSHNPEIEVTAVAARELNDALKDQGERAEFDKLLALDRFDLMIRVAELLLLMAADGYPPQCVTSPGRFFDPMRISAMIDALPLTMTNDGFDLNTNAPRAKEQLEALGSRYGYDVTWANAAAGIDAAVTQLAVMGHKFLGIFLGPTMQLIDNSNAETALGKALRALLPPSVIGQAATVDGIAVRLTQQQAQSQFNVICGWLLHCKRFSAIFAVVFVSTVVCPACLCGGVPLALMNSASEVPIGSSTSEGR